MGQSIRPKEGKIQAIRDAVRPTAKKQVKSFIGIVGFYRKFIPTCNLSTVASPLIDLTKKDRPKNIKDCQNHHEKYRLSLKTLLQQGISEPEFYGDLVYRFRKIVGKSNFSEQFRKLINRYKRIGYSLDIMRQTACLVVNPIIVDGYASLFNCTTAFRVSDSMTASS